MLVGWFSGLGKVKGGRGLGVVRVGINFTNNMKLITISGRYYSKSFIPVAS